MRRAAWDRRRPFRGVLAVALTLAVIAVVAALATLLQPPAEPLGGRPQVVDGDTLRFGATRVRLTGLDAPELDQTCLDGGGAEYGCGAEAKAFLVGFIDGRTTRCLRSGSDKYGRVLATCAVDGADLGNAIVGAGWAVAEADYLFALGEARLQKRGIWRGRFEAPADWRRDHGAAEPGLWDWIRAWFQ
jgi:endonuclease YncB( thermonuclease family)